MAECSGGCTPPPVFEIRTAVVENLAECAALVIYYRRRAILAGVWPERHAHITSCPRVRLVPGRVRW